MSKKKVKKASSSKKRHVLKRKDSPKSTASPRIIKTRKPKRED